MGLLELSVKTPNCYRSPCMSPDSSVPLKAGAMRAHRDGDGPGITAAAVIVALVLGMIGIFVSAAGAEPQIDQPAPEFTTVDAKRNTVRLSEYRGKTVVLEWTNADCPYTRKHYSSGNMQNVQALARKNGIVWLSVVSSAPGKQGYVNGPAADALTQSRGAFPTAVLMDPSGTLGRLYGAKTTPHMVVIDKEGALQYMGGIDSMPNPRAG